MTDVVDLLHGQEEVRFCSALAIVLQYDDEGWPVLRGLLGTMERRWKKEPREFPFLDLDDGKIENVDVSVEEPVEGAKAEGRYDLVARFTLRRKGSDAADAYVLIFEAKVAAVGAHGRQFSTYREGLSRLRKQGGSVGETVFGLLTVDPGRDLVNRDEDYDEIVQFHLGWADILEVVEKGSRKKSPMDALRDSFCDAVKRWTVKLEDYNEVLKGETLPFPVLLDALDAICRQLSTRCGAESLIRDPAGAQGPVWIVKKDKKRGEKHDGCYRYGYWWRCNDRWASLSLAWHYFEKGMKSLSGGAIPCPGGEIYIPYLELWTSQRGEEGPAELWPQSEILHLLSEEAVDTVGTWLVEGAKGEVPWQ